MNALKRLFRFAEPAKPAVKIEGVPVEIFRAGDYGKLGKYSEADLAAIAANFNPALHQPPLTRHHNDTDGPHGIVTGLIAQGKSLMATFGDVADDFKSWLGQHAYAKRSVEIYPADTSPNGKPMVRAVSFVSVPQVKGMAPLPTFADARGAFVVIDFAEGDAPGDGDENPAARRLIETGKGGNGDHTHLAMTDEDGNGTTTGPLVVPDAGNGPCCWPRNVWINPAGHVHEVKAYTVQPAEGHSHQLTVTTGDEDWSEDVPDDDSPYGILMGESPDDARARKFGDDVPAKTEGGEKFTAAAYLYTPDPKKPSTWKLRIEETPGKITVAQLGRAAAALGKGFRGNKADVSEADAAKCKAKLRAAYKAAGIKPKDYPEVIKMMEDKQMDEPIVNEEQARLRTELDATVAKFAESQKEIEVLKRQNRRVALAARLAALQELPPAIKNRPGLLEFCDSLAERPGVLKFGDKATEIDPVDYFFETLGEAAKLGAVPLASDSRLNRDTPHDAPGDTYAEINKRAIAYQEEHKVAFAEALRVVGQTLPRPA